jgi:hypothetical protein
MRAPGRDTRDSRPAILFRRCRIREAIIRGVDEGRPTGADPEEDEETRVKYVLLILDTPTEPAPGTPEYNSWYAEVGAWYEKWGATGKLDGGHQLQGAAAAKTVRGSGVTDGPFMETKEVLGGYSVIDADTMDEAADIAKTWPGVDRGWITIEVRPAIEMG